MVGACHLLLLLLITRVPATLAQTADDCLCFDRWTEELVRRMVDFKQAEGDYEYTGVIEGMLGSFYKACVCDDVLRMALSMTVTSADLYAESNGTVISANVSTAFMDLRNKINQVGGKDFANVFEKVLIDEDMITKAAPDAVTLSVEIVLRGTNYTMATLMDGALREATINPISSSENILPFLGAFVMSAWKIVECTGSPPPAPSGDITRNWTDLVVPPTTARYLCADDQYVVPLGNGSSTCEHDSLAWTELDQLTCESGCGADPPQLPIHSLRNWVNSTREIGHVLEYYCQHGFRSGDGENCTTECTTSGQWSELPPTFFCSEKPCLKDIPQVPAHAATNFQETLRMAKTEVKYWCTPGYRAPKNRNTSVTCSKGEWTSLQQKWSCRNILALNRAETLKGEMDVPDDELTQAEKKRKLSMATEPLYFWIVTIPSIIGMMIGMTICLCCTRTDSPLYFICGGNRSKQRGYDNYMRKFGNN